MTAERLQRVEPHHREKKIKDKVLCKVKALEVYTAFYPPANLWKSERMSDEASVRSLPILASTVSLMLWVSFRTGARKDCIQYKHVQEG